MIINKIPVEIVNFRIVRVTIPKPSDVYINTIPEEHWLKTRTILPEATYASKQALGLTAPITDVKGVRPIIVFDELQSDVKPGDEIIFGKHLFTVINSNTALCNTVIGFYPYHNKKEPTSSFIDAALYQYVIDWWNKVVATGTPTLKIINKQKVEIKLLESCFSVPTLNALSGINKDLVTTGVPYWTRSREDEFNGTIIDAEGSIVKVPIYKKDINICPLIRFNTTDMVDILERNNIRESVLFEMNNRIYRMISKNKAICLNSIGISCYSSGICEFGNSTQEEEFYLSSELYETFFEWRRSLM